MKRLQVRVVETSLEFCCKVESLRSEAEPEPVTFLFQVLKSSVKIFAAKPSTRGEECLY